MANKTFYYYDIKGRCRELKDEKTAEKVEIAYLKINTLKPEARKELRIYYKIAHFETVVGYTTKKKYFGLYAYEGEMKLQKLLNKYGLTAKDAFYYNFYFIIEG